MSKPFKFNPYKHNTLDIPLGSVIDTSKRDAQERKNLREVQEEIRLKYLLTLALIVSAIWVRFYFF